MNKKCLIIKNIKRCYLVILHVRFKKCAQVTTFNSVNKAASVQSPNTIPEDLEKGFTGKSFDYS